MLRDAYFRERRSGDRERGVFISEIDWETTGETGKKGGEGREQTFRDVSGRSILLEIAENRPFTDDYCRNYWKL